MLSTTGKATYACMYVYACTCMDVIHMYNNKEKVKMIYVHVHV